MAKKLTPLEQKLIKNSSAMKQNKDSDAFCSYIIQRNMHIGESLGIGTQPIAKEVIELINDIEFIKSLDLFSPAYIDNLVMYIYLLASPLPGTEYFISIIDKYIKPEGRSRTTSSFRKLMAGYFIYRVTNSRLKNKTSVNAAKKAMVKSLKVDNRTIERAYSSIKKAFKTIKKEKANLDNSLLLIFDLIIFLNFFYDDVDFIEMKKHIGKHHHTQKQHQNLIDAYQELCNTISYPLIKDAKKFLKLNLEHFKEEFTPEFIEKVLKFRKSKKQINFYTNEVTALLFITASNSFMPNILKTKSLMDKVFT